MCGPFIAISVCILYVICTQDEWIPVVGPISRDEYETNRKRIPSKLHLGAGIHYRCTFDLSLKHENFHGDLYMSHQTGRLFVASSVEQILVSSSVFGGELMSASLGSDKFDDMSL